MPGMTLLPFKRVELVIQSVSNVGRCLNCALRDRRSGQARESARAGGWYCENAMDWNDDARRVLERETIYLRERLRARVETLVREAGRTQVRLSDLEQARRMSGHAPSGPPPAPIDEPAWPVTFGTYHVLDPEASVAICTLAGEALADEIAARRPP